MAHCNLIEVAVALPLHKNFTYRLPPSYAGSVQIGMRVLVPFGRRNLTGYVVGFPETAPCDDIKEVQDLLDEEPLFGSLDLQFYEWTSRYYYYPLGQTISAALPQGINTAYRQILSLTEKGGQMLHEGSGSDQSLPILKVLDREGKVPLKKLEKIVGKYNFYYQLNHLRRNGCIQMELQKARQGLQAKKEKWFSVRSSAVQESLKGKQKQLYQFLVERGPVPLRVLNETFGNSSSAITSLVKKELLLYSEREVFRKPAPEEEVFTEPVHRVTHDQDAILRRVRRGIDDRTFLPFLLHGVTGSGKTEIYLRVMEEVLDKGRQCLLLVPEISLTGQLWDRVCSRITAPVSMLHSSLTPAERFDAWRMIRRGNIKIVIGARSAVFASFADLGAIIVDEEHDPSYKQEDKLRYSARDISLIKGKFAQAVVLLGSATPSLESYANALKKKYVLGNLSKRIEDRKLPHIKIIDLRITQNAKNSAQSILSPRLREAIGTRLEKRQQCLLFLNRRGFAPVFLCQQCGYTFRCPNCDVSLIHHHRERTLRCHYCDLAMPLPESCPHCKSFFLVPLGWGTERLEKEIQLLFPDARIARMDRDTTAAKGASRSLLKRIFTGDIDILIGTQMITKGHHLPQVTLVGVVCADHSLNFPDYRAGERTFQLLTQVAGRAGRGDVPGEVFIQTYNPDHYSIVCAQRHDYRAFFERELHHREELGYPPCKRMINFRLEGSHRERLLAYIKDLEQVSKKFLAELKLAGLVEILGPAPAPWGKIKGKYRYQMLLKSARMQPLRLLASRILNHATTSFKGREVSLTVDVDPLFIL